MPDLFLIEALRLCRRCKNYFSRRGALAVGSGQLAVSSGQLVAHSYILASIHTFISQFIHHPYSLYARFTSAANALFFRVSQCGFFTEVLLCVSLKNPEGLSSVWSGSSVLYQGP